MLERVPKIVQVIDRPKNIKHKKFIRKAVSANSRRIKRFAVKIEQKRQNFCPGIIDYGDFQELKENLQVENPPNGFFPFAEKIGLAWDETPQKEREELGIPELYASRKTTESALFSISGGSAAIRRMALSRLVIKGKYSLRHKMVLDLIKNLRKSKNGEIKKKLEALDAIFDSIEFNGLSSPVSYALKEEESKVRFRFPNFSEARAIMHSDVESIETEISKRMCFGFSSVQ